MANKNITQLTPQVGSANTTSLFYAVTGGNTDTSLPLTVFVNNLGLTGVPTTPTASPGTNTTQIASTAFVQAAVSGGTYAGSFTTLTASGAATLNTLSSSGATITGGTINGTPVGGTTPSTGAFTTLSASSTVSGSGFSTYLASPPAIGGTAPAAGAFTTLMATSTVSGAGFTARFSSPGPIGDVTASTGKFTTLQATGAITPSTTSDIVGTTLADNANAGSVGEYITNSTGLVSITSGTPFNATSVSLTAGDWEVSGIVTFVPAGTTTVSALQAGISLVSATYGSANTGSFNLLAASFNTGSTQAYPSPTVRINISTTTTVYLVGTLAFGTSTAQGEGFIRARRVR